MKKMAMEGVQCVQKLYTSAGLSWLAGVPGVFVCVATRCNLPASLYSCSCWQL